MTADLTLDDVEIGDDGYMVGRAHFALHVEYDSGAWDADGRQAARSGWCVTATLIGFQVGALILTREQAVRASSEAHIAALEEQTAERHAQELEEAA